MKTGTRLLVGGGVGIALGITAGGLAFAFAPPVEFPGQWAWLNNWGRLGVTFAAGWFVFVLSLVLTIFSIVASGFNEMEARRR